MTETNARSIVKSVTWRVIATIVNIAMVWAITGSIKSSVVFGIVNAAISFALYWLHERIWNKIRFGRTP